MKIENIQRNGNIFTVSFKPTFIEKIFGVKPKTKRYITFGDIYRYRGGQQYFKEDGYVLGNGHWVGEALDAFQKRF